MDISNGVGEIFVVGERRQNEAIRGGFYYELVTFNDISVTAKVFPYGQAELGNVGDVKKGDIIEIPMEIWLQFLLVSIPGFDQEQAILGLQRLSHEIRGRLANLLGAAKERKNLRAETIPRLREEVNERCKKIMDIQKLLGSHPTLLNKVLQEFVDRETLSGRRTRYIDFEGLLRKAKDIDFIIALLEVAGVPRDNATYFFSGSLQRQIHKNGATKE